MGFGKCNEAINFVKIIGKMIKQRKDAAEQYDQAERLELAAIERSESQVLQQYLPEQLSTDEIQSLVDKAITQSNAQGMQDMGRVMGMLQTEIAGRADMGEVSAIVKSRLS